MKASDIITQLAVLLPQLTDKFTDDIELTSLVRNGSIVTANCASKHSLEVGDAVAIVNSITRIPITTLSRSGTVGMLVTSRVHDLTNGIVTTITLSGANEPEFVGTFDVINVVNRKTITFIMSDSGPTLATGTCWLENAESALRSYNTTYRAASIPDDFTFTFNHPVTDMDDPIGSMIARIKPRISGTIDIERAIAAYTKQALNKYWMFVVLEDVNASKSRDINSDAVDNLQRGHEYRQQIVQPFGIYVFIPVTDEIAARESRDVAEDLFRPICRSLLFSKFNSGLYVGAQNTVQFTGHGVYKYDTALYIHNYGFQQVADIVFEDTVGHDLDVAFRDLEFTMDPDIGTGTLTGEVDLDDTPL